MMGEIKLLIQVEGEKVYITPLGLPFTVKREGFEKVMGAMGDNTYIHSVPAESYNALAKIASYG